MTYEHLYHFSITCRYPVRSAVPVRLTFPIGISEKKYRPAGQSFPDMKKTINSSDYRDYVIKNGKFIGAFEEMYQNIDDPWCIGDAKDIQYDMILYLLEKYRIFPSRILDIGCGKGAFSSILKQKRPDAVILGIDISPTAIKKAKEKYSRNGLSFQDIDICKTYTELDTKFDLIIMSQLVWYILPEFESIVNKLIGSNLSENGFFIINQAFYSPEDQTYGKEIISTVQDLLGLVRASPTEIIETNRFSNHNAVILYSNCPQI
jgi:SAM-dependent methyltransferase